MNWFVLYTKSNYEIKVAAGINALGIEAYCPTYTHLKHYSDRKKKVERALLPSYVLVRTTEKERSKVFVVPGVVRYVFWLGRPAAVKEEEIERLKNNLNGVYTSITLTQIQKGDLLDIPDGPFKGQRGSVVIANKNKVTLELPSLGILVSLTRNVA